MFSFPVSCAKTVNLCKLQREVKAAPNCDALKKYPSDFTSTQQHNRGPVAQVWRKARELWDPQLQRQVRSETINY